MKKVQILAVLFLTLASGCIKRDWNNFEVVHFTVLSEQPHDLTFAYKVRVETITDSTHIQFAVMHGDAVVTTNNESEPAIVELRYKNRSQTRTIQAHDREIWVIFP